MFHAVSRRMRAWSGDPPTLPSILSRSRLTRTFALPRFGRATLCEAHFNPCDARTNGAVCWQIRTRLHPHCPRHEIRESQHLITARRELRPRLFGIIDKPLFSNPLWRSWGLNRKLEADEFNRTIDEFSGEVGNSSGESCQLSHGSCQLSDQSGQCSSQLWQPCGGVAMVPGNVICFEAGAGKVASRVANLAGTVGQVWSAVGAGGGGVVGADGVAMAGDARWRDERH